jgi:hypothetical protein
MLFFRAAVTRLAESAVRTAVTAHHRALVEAHGEPRDASGNAQELIVIGMGKLGGAELNVSWPVAVSKPWDLAVFGGFRWLRLKEKYAITTSSPYVPPSPAGIWETTDIFDASNKFYGGQVGARGTWRQGNWMANGAVQVALGGMVQDVDVQGSLHLLVRA